VFADAIAVPSRKKWVAPKSVNQKRYVDAIRNHDMVFAIGPAGRLSRSWRWPWPSPR
jgi:phosphate starvation-inducible PhoH-like protein